MSSLSRKCFLRCLSNLHPDIALHDGVPTIIGRSSETKIKDKRCSKQQLKLYPIFKDFTIKVEQIGQNNSSLNGITIGFNKNVIAHHGDVINVLAPNQHSHKIYFDPIPENSDNEIKSSKKRKSIDEESNDLAPPKKMEKKSPENGSFKSMKFFNFDFNNVSRNDKSTWDKVADGELYVMNWKECEPRSKIAGFDLDYTLIGTQSGKVFPVDHNDWKILYPEVPGKLKKLYADGYKIVVLTNQSGISKGKLSIENFMIKAENIAKKIGVPMQLFCCVGDSGSGGMFRKPRIGIWKLLEEKMNGSSEINMEDSFYCGDAAGRNKDWEPKKKKDFSCSDRLLAINLNLRFYTPEEYFLKHKATKKFSLPEFNPITFKCETSLLEPNSAKVTSDHQEVIMMVGIQGSGKSYFSKKYLVPKDYVIASNDLTGGREKTIKLVDKTLSEGKSVVIDNTHGDRDTRQKFISVAKKHGVNCRCFIMKTSPQHARHNNIFRELTGVNHTKIKEVLFNSYKARYQNPELSEGFSEIVNINFIPDFDDKESKALYSMYLQEK